MIDAIERQIIRKFGEGFPVMDTPCRLCGERYGDHQGTLCPSKAEINPEQTYYLHAAAREMKGVLQQFVRYCRQWEEAHGPITDGRALILKNAERALAMAEGKTDEFHAVINKERN